MLYTRDSRHRLTNPMISLVVQNSAVLASSFQRPLVEIHGVQLSKRDIYEQWKVRLLLPVTLTRISASRASSATWLTNRTEASNPIHRSISSTLSASGPQRLVACPCPHALSVSTVIAIT